ncbi:unnamed protein product [Litomosoides sigmodontis]|uniref:Fcf2 pre-rRNA processing C-terminal domain-containing protein n=1 Tax=Litomosoides sigmodontis TaxID=42156 RepID=A0A3P6T8S8_LITSI|nr:unnamed protein product [Litomosoides sigmodontis]
MRTGAGKMLVPNSEGTSSSDSEDNEQNVEEKILRKAVNFHCFPETEEVERDDLFVLDADGTSNINANIVNESSFATGCNTENDKTPDIYSTLDETTKKLLSKSIIKPGFEKYLGEGHVPMSWRALKRRRKMERELTKGDAWYNLPATEMTEERERDLSIIQMRGSLDPKAHYRKNDRSSVLPKYFQVGTVVETKVDFYSSRVPKKQRKRTIVEELLADADLQTRQRKKYQEIKAREAVTKRGAFRHSSYRKKGKFRQNSKV